MSYEKKAMSLMNKYPAISDLRKKAHQRIPLVAKEYMETGTDDDDTLNQNRIALKKIKFKPRFLKGSLAPSIETNLFGKKYDFPFGIAPIGLTGLMWPNIEIILAKAAKTYNLPFCLSTLATETPERVGPHMGNNGWFQLYTPKEKHLAYKLLERAKNSGFHTLVITIDIPIPSRRQRTKRAGLQTPPKITPNFIWQGITHPQWALATLKRGLPSLRTIAEHSEFKDMMSVEKFVAKQMGGNLSWDYVVDLKNQWDGPVLLKGIMHEADAIKAVELGFDGIFVSNHGGRQFDGALSPIEVLPKIVEAVGGKTTICFDSGVRSGLDILRALSLGADMVFLGRAFLYGVSALGKYGAAHTIQILNGELQNAMINLGIESLEEIRALEKIISD